jgi:pseudouridine-5'-monophosphatase
LNASWLVQREAARYIYERCPGLEDKLSIDDFLKERNIKQNELFGSVQPMEGAVKLVRHLVSEFVPDQRWNGDD